MFLNKFTILFLLFLLGVYLLHTPIYSKSAAHPFHNAEWIGFTQDARAEEWSTRHVTFNQPPHDISSWLPTPEELHQTPRTSFVAPLLRKEFSIKRRVESATVTVSGLGLYELWLNGTKANDHVLEPAQTSYDKRAFYNVIDVTQQLRYGDNVIGLMLGNGFFGQNIAFAPDLSYGAPRAILTLVVKYADGSEWKLHSDDNWRASSGPLLFDNIFMGETYDARLYPQGWAEPDFNDSRWSPAEIMAAPTNQLEPQAMEPMRKVREVNPVAILPAEDGWILDMGINMTGWLQFSLSERKGTVISIRFAEHLMPDRMNIDSASTGIHATGGEQKHIYIFSGDGLETWEPRFSYQGFRYAQIKGLSKKPKLDQFTAWLIRTDVSRAGTFESSDPLINKFYEVSMLTIEDNMQGLLSDCPHRERCAWMGDIHAVAEAATYNFDLRKFWRKTTHDIETMLGTGGGSPNGGLPLDPRAPTNIAVGKRDCGQARPDWGAATVLVPWYAYLYYGDLALLEESWPMMEDWMAYLEEFAVQDGIINDGFGDWCPPGSNTKMDTPSALTSTALYYQSLTYMETMATALNKSSAAAHYKNQATVIKDAFNQRFYTSYEIATTPTGSSPRIVINNASYGDGSSKQVNLTQKIQQLITEGTYSFKVDNAFIGSDPAPGVVKKLVLEYTINGELKHQVYTENSNVHFFNRTIATYGSQTGSAFALHTGIVPEDKRQLIADGLASLIMEESNGHYTTGIFGHRPLYTVLNDYGHSHVTRHLWSIIDWPSLGFMTEKHGLTTWPEVPYNWQEGRRYRRNSFNHPMHSGFAATFHESIGGIRPDAEHPGFEQFILRPTFLADLDWAKATYKAPQGLISSHWLREGNDIIWNIEIPTGTQAEIQLPLIEKKHIYLKGKQLNRNQFTLESGKWAIGIRATYP
ncbi:family 78 glycoside hydrolase catalytic domain [Coraliomargarita sp. SDUM461004]|uniref:alpha-L-rhamnosidase n=1 Tax=Thalassobacterium sedimentorum TaxID=3041258 RepID=A0ABU1AMY7_9BACT|nr:family 78 glycoside hydrolase catalytic domain [Coraliomargarita sp. SDUM461004]MDQ8196109.1 family 78 glycoside hydrolase catalytic domain [Coraliomargarita sp. SDUM461004]